MILCAAIKLKILTLDDREVETVICGRRHGDCFTLLKDFGIKKKISEVQGFIDTLGNFYNRKEALAHAIQCGQLPLEIIWRKTDDSDKAELYSEDLY